MNDDRGKIWSQQRRRSCSRDVAMAKWFASTLYYQHPAIHPLPSSIFSLSKVSKDVGTAGSSTMQMTRASSSSKQQPHSIHNRVRLPAAGCMGGLGIISLYHPTESTRLPQQTTLLASRINGGTMTNPRLLEYHHYCINDVMIGRRPFRVCFILGCQGFRNRRKIYGRR